MYRMNWDIQFKNTETNKTYKLMLVSSFEIQKSVENLVDTADIILPESISNKVLNIEQQIGRGTEVTIKLGYEDNTREDKGLRTEFIGYIREISTDNSTTKISCEDALFLFRKAVKDEELKGKKMSQIAQRLIDQIDKSFKLVCDYDLSYEKFVLYKATAYDVLKKLAEETKANIYFDTIKKELHIHLPYKQKGGEVTYDLSKNVEKTSLEFKQKKDRKFEITMETTNAKGEVISVKSGDPGGDSVNIKQSSMSKADLKKIADAEHIKRSADAFEGTIDTWCIPYVEPTYTAILKDKDYPKKEGSYYVPKVVTSFSEAGIKRVVSIGIKLS